MIYVKVKKIHIIILISALVAGIVGFLLLGLLRGKANGMIAPVKVPYPIVSDDASYEDRVFDTNAMHEVNIKISNKDWADLTQYPLAKRKYCVDVVIDGVLFENVAISTKGNSSLKDISEGPSEGPAANRFSFKLDFGKYEKDQSYFGLDVLNLNNIFGDATYMNDYLAYHIFREVDVPAPLVSFVYVKLNGKNFGLYSAVEGIGESFMKRNNLTGNLYKPEQTKGMDHGASLTYVDNHEKNYIDVFNNAETVITDADKSRFIQSLKLLNKRTNLEQVLDVEEVIRYFVAHNFLLSYDSYTGKSIHNYFLLENSGKLSMIPWDYNLSFGRFNMKEDINTIVNYGIDSPTNNTTSKERPMWYWIEADENYLAMYHTLMNELLVRYFESGKYEEEIDSAYQMIQPYMKADVSAFYTTQQIDQAIDTLKLFCNHRFQSIRLQLDGKLSTKTDLQEKKMQVDSSSIDLNDMGLVADDSLRSNNNNSKDQSKESHDLEKSKTTDK